MKKILQLIDQKNEEFAKLPFFQFMEDESIDPRQKLAFSPVITPLALEFSKLCTQVFRQEAAGNRVQEIVNKHTQEEHFHWQWLLEDMGKMGTDYTMRFSDVVRFLWSDHTKVSRSMYSLFERYTRDADPVMRLIAIEVSEVTANVFFHSTKSAALQLQEMTGQEFRYYGMCHNHIENTHTLRTPEVTAYIQSIELTDDVRQRALELIDKSFDYFADLVEEFLVFAQAHPYQEPPSVKIKKDQLLSSVA